MQNIQDWTRLSPEEIDFLTICENWYRFSQIPEWGKLRDFLGSLVDEAQKDLYDCRSSDPAVSHALRLAWQARRDMMLAVIGHVEAHIQERERLIAAATLLPEEQE